jgi:hypothetical protein
MRKPPTRTDKRTRARATATTPPTNGAPSAASDVELAATATDEAIADFVCSPPAAADHVLVVVTASTGDVIVQDRTASECKRNPVGVAAQIAVACERWADVERRACRFRATWMRGEKTLATHSWQCGASEGGAPELDGSVISFLIQMQRNNQEEHKLKIERSEMEIEGWKTLLGFADKRIASLERDNQELRDRLRKLDDVGSELAIENARADIEARQRTADLLEKRVLPIAQAVIAHQMESAAAAAQPIAAHEERQEK